STKPSTPSTRAAASSRCCLPAEPGQGLPAGRIPPPAPVQCRVGSGVKKMAQSKDQSDPRPTPERRPAPAEPGGEGKRKHQEDLLDEAVEETFPASDPISPKQ